jgi:hypothetical protein
LGLHIAHSFCSSFETTSQQIANPTISLRYQAVEKRCIGLSGKAAAILKPQA